MRKQVIILVTEPEYFTAESLRRMRKIGRVIALRMSRRELLRAVEHIDALVVRVETPVDEKLLRRAKRLRCVVSATTGLDHIDLRALRRRFIPLFSLHGTHSVSTAEHALALLFSAARNVLPAHAHLASNGWERWRYIGMELAGKTLGIVGIGRIGTEVAKRARGLRMHVIAYDPYLSKQEIRRRGARKVNWATLLGESDAITLHAPLTRETEGMFGLKELAAVKPSLIIVNTARGAIVKENALLSALGKNKICAAAIDVYPEEPLPRSNALRRYARGHNNLILTPHIGASTREAVQNASEFAADALTVFFD